MEQDLPVPQDAQPTTLGSLPSEILQNIFYFTTSTTLFQLIQVNRKFFDVTSECRKLILHHLRHVPGIKLGLDHRSVSTSDLFLLYRQRAVSNLFGAHFTADCQNLVPALTSPGIFDPRASYLTAETQSCVVFQNLCRIRLNLHSNATYGDTIETPYGDGHAKIIQVVQRSYYVSVLYAWTPPGKEGAEHTSFAESAISRSPQQTDSHSGYETRDGLWYKSRRRSSKIPAPPPPPRIRYHLFHFDIFRSIRPVFFPIPTHNSSRYHELVPVHLAVHNRSQCAILWDLPGSVAPTWNATVCLYKAEGLSRDEPGHYDVWVVYPFDHPASDHRPGILIGDREIAVPGSDSDEEAGSRMGRRSRTYTKYQAQGSGGTRNRHNDTDLRFLYFPLKPRAISFFKEGRRLSLYAPGSVAPYTTLLANDSIRSRSLPPSTFPSISVPGVVPWPRGLCRRVRRMNHTSINGHHFTLSKPFFSRHETIIRPTPVDHSPDSDTDVILESDCITNVLCLGTARISPFKIAAGTQNASGPQVLTIVQVRERKSQDDCLHSGYKDDLPPGLPRPPRELRRQRTPNNPNTVQGVGVNGVSVPDVPVEDENSSNEEEHHSEPEIEVLSDSDTDDTGHGPLMGTEVRVVARLWGWNTQSTSLTGFDTVCVSPRGERIAVALWDRILIYVLDPGALCEEVWDDGSSSSDGNISDDGSSFNHDSESDHDFDSAPDITENFLANDGEDESEHVNLESGGAGENHIATAPAFAAAPEPALVLPILPPNPAPPPAPASLVSNTSTSIPYLANHYPHVKDKNLGGSVVILRPTVLKMDAGAIVHKMSWGQGKPPKEEDDQEDGDAEEEVKEGGLLTSMVGGEDAATENAKDEEREVVVAGESTLPIAQANAEQSLSETPSMAVDVEIVDAQEKSEASPGPESALPPKIIPIDPIAVSAEQSSNSNPKEMPEVFLLESPTANPVGRPETSLVDEIPPAPFSDLTLTGQIKHIDRPPEYYCMTLAEKDFFGPHTFVTLGSFSSSSTGLPGPWVRKTLEQKAADQVDETEKGENEKPPTSSSDPPLEDGEKPKTSASETKESEPTTLSPEQAEQAGPSGTEEDENPVPDIPMFDPDLEKGPHSPPLTPYPKRVPHKRPAENELVVITDRGIQIWDLSVWSTGKRIRQELKVEADKEA